MPFKARFVAANRYRLETFLPKAFPATWNFIRLFVPCDAPGLLCMVPAAGDLAAEAAVSKLIASGDCRLCCTVPELRIVRVMAVVWSGLSDKRMPSRRAEELFPATSPRRRKTAGFPGGCERTPGITHQKYAAVVPVREIVMGNEGPIV